MKIKREEAIINKEKEMKELQNKYFEWKANCSKEGRTG
jgi:hypothetical protein